MVFMYIIRLLRINVNLPATCRFNIIRRHAVDVRVREIIRNYRHYTSNDTQCIRAQRRIKNSGRAASSTRCCSKKKLRRAELIDCGSVRTLRRTAATITRCRRGTILGRVLLPLCFFSTAGFIIAYMYVM